MNKIEGKMREKKMRKETLKLSSLAFLSLFFLLVACVYEHYLEQQGRPTVAHRKDDNI